ncbi:MAG TPA: dipeptide epimerase [Candidatus Baltobacteraceae bacterium]|nr:dipeptide epimerase [Candidatus Baltobacteraceae bacterium]
MDVVARVERWPIRHPFSITGHTFTESEVVLVELRDGEARGRGEASGVYYTGDTPERCVAQIEAVAGRIAAGAGRDDLLELLPAGGARNAVDCALWDLEARREHRPAWRIAGLDEPRPLLTTHTIGAAEPSEMARAALEFRTARALKLKLTGSPLDADRVRAVRAARPDVWLAVDANQGFTVESLRELLPALVAANVRLLEQPFPIGAEADMEGLESPIPTAADESLQDIDDLARLAGRFDTVNIKLDKCGGLTRALAIADRARALGMQVMVGCMMATSLGIAPAALVGQLCDVVDLDGPLILADDRKPPVTYDDGYLRVPDALWGGA